jgi:methylphosphotriester-DNA--protein-cysteine methyltransferase
VSITNRDPIRDCKRCSRELAPGALACDHCHALVHSEELEQLSADAKALEAHGDLRQAREKWLSGLALLPPTSKQAEWIRQHAQALDSAGGVRQPQSDVDPKFFSFRCDLFGCVWGEVWDRLRGADSDSRDGALR